jgi:RND family efflux transporter MFP subunit
MTTALPKRRRAPAAGLLACAGAAALSLQACKPVQSAADPRTGTPLVRVVTVAPGRPSTRSFTGAVAARVQSDLGFRVAGKVVQRFVDVGQPVHAGQPLMRLDRTDLAHAIAAQAANVAAAKARELQASAEERRYRALVPSGAASRSQYDQARAAADSARAVREAAEAQARLTEDDGAYATLLADSDGIVVATLAEPGQVVTAGQSVLRLACAGAREAAIDLPETLRPPIGSVASATLFGSNAPPEPARLRQLSDAADPRTRTFEARYVLGDTLGHAPLGSTVTLRIAASGAADRGIAVPLAALTDTGAGPGVWVVDTPRPGAGGAMVHFRPVTLAALGDEQATVQSGLHAGERVVALGARLLHEDEAVRTEADQVAAR